MISIANILRPPLLLFAFCIPYMLRTKIIRIDNCVGAIDRLKSQMWVCEYNESLPFALYAFIGIIKKNAALEHSKSFLPISACLLFSSMKA